jgi:hypothetical protein
VTQGVGPEFKPQYHKKKKFQMLTDIKQLLFEGEVSKLNAFSPQLSQEEMLLEVAAHTIFAWCWTRALGNYNGNHYR